MSSTTNKRRKVTVDIKQTKLERGSVFARLGNKEKRKKFKQEAEAKAKKEIPKLENEGSDERKKAKSTFKPEDGSSQKKVAKGKDFSSTSKPKISNDDTKEHQKHHKHSDQVEMDELSETGRAHSKHRVDRSDRKLEKMENLIIEKRVSPSSIDQSRSASPNPLSPKKKSKKHSTKHISRDKSHDTHQRFQSVSPEPVEIQKHKERGRSREKKKTSKERSRKVKEIDDEYSYERKVASASKHSAKVKKSSKHMKQEKSHSDEFEYEKKHKSKHTREISVEEKLPAKISPITFEESSDEYYRKHEKTEERGKAKRRKHENVSPSGSPIRHKKSKRHPSYEERRSETSSPVKSHSKKRSHKDIDAPSKKKVQKEDSLQGTYSDFSSTSKTSQPEYSEISHTSGGNEEQYSSDSYTEKETKKRSKMKKKAKRDVDVTTTKPRYEVIDDDFSDDFKKTKKRKRKREDKTPPPQTPPPKEIRRHSEKERRRDDTPEKKADSYIRLPQGKTRNQEKYTREKHERRSSHDVVEPRRPKLSSEIKSDIRNPDEKYYETRKERERDIHEERKDAYASAKHSRDSGYPLERRETSYAKSKVHSRHLSQERTSDKIIDWQRKSSRHTVGERKESIPRLMTMSHSLDRHSGSSRAPPSKFVQQRKMLDSDYAYTHEQAKSEVNRSGRNVERVKRISEGRPAPPPPLLPPTFQRSHTPPLTLSHVRDKHGYADQDRILDTDRKHKHVVPRHDSRERKYNPMHEDSGDRRVRSGSRDSRSSSLRHSSQDSKGKQRLHGEAAVIRSIQSPRSDRNSSLEKRDHKKSINRVTKITKSEKGSDYTRSSHRSLERVITKSKIRTGKLRQGERSLVIKQQSSERLVRRAGSSHSSQDRDKKKKLGLKPSSSIKRKTRESSRTSSHASSEKRKEKPQGKQREKKKDGGISDSEINKLIKDEEEKTPTEVDWSELPIETPTKSESTREQSSILSKFSPGNILRNTGIIMDMLPQRVIDKINDLESESADKDSPPAGSKGLVSQCLRNGLNAYSDERLRKHLLCYNSDYRHPLYPPRIINAKTYSASMKEYMQKIRLVEAV